MSDLEVTARRGAKGGSTPDLAPSGAGRPGRQAPLASLILGPAFLAFLAFPRVRENPHLEWTIVGVACFFVAWSLCLWLVGARRGQRFAIEFTRPLKSHYIQGCVQFSIYLYWGWYWPNVYAELPLILSQFVFLYLFDMHLSWSRGRAWRWGLGALPIILSTNFFLWFRDDWYYLQYALVATCVLGKEFLRWQRDGKSTHIFNPSAFGLAVFSMFLIATGTTVGLTWGVEVASTLALPPHIYLWIFLGGLIVQYFFAVTLMTLSAVAVLYVLNLWYTGTTDVYHFVDTNIPIAVFLGLHLLMTDPATSPRSNLGKIVFGGLYGLANFVLYSVLTDLGIPEFYDKLLPVPILNLLVPWIERTTRSPFVARLMRWETSFDPRRMNLVHMGCWIALFATMLGTGFVDAPHPGASIAFWKKAFDEGKPRAAEKLVRMVGSRAAAGSAPSNNELGRIYLEGKMAKQDRDAAAYYFSRACQLGYVQGCANLTQLFVDQQVPWNGAVESALAHLEETCGQRKDGRNCFLAGLAYETGKGRQQNLERAKELYSAACERGHAEACQRLEQLRADPARPATPPAPAVGSSR